MAGERRDSIRIRVEKIDYEVVGGEFQEILAAVKALPKRRFNGQLKLWEVDGSLAMVRGQIENSGFYLEGGTPVTGAERTAEPVRTEEQIKLNVAGYPLLLTGASFQEMLTAIKEVPGRRFDGETKQWSLPGTLAEIQAHFEKRKMRLERVETAAAPTAPLFDDEGFDEAEIDFSPSRRPAPPPPDDLFPPQDMYDDFQDEEDYDEVPFSPAEPTRPQPSASAQPSANKSAAFSGRRDQIRVIVGNMSLVVVGGSFQEMLTAIKEIPGRRFDSESKRWLLSEDINSVQQHIKAKGFRLEEG
jgi:hypothetical protein